MLRGGDAPTHAATTPVLGWECGHTNKLLQGKQGRELSPPPLYLCVLVSLRYRQQVSGAGYSSPLLWRSNLLPGHRGVKKHACGGRGDSVGAPVAAHPVGTCSYARTKRLARKSPQKLAVEARVEPISADLPSLTTKLPFHAHQLLTSAFLQHQQYVHSCQKYKGAVSFDLPSVPPVSDSH